MLKLAAAILALLPAAACGEPRRLPLDPAHAAIGFRAYAFGLVPVEGSFTRFQGELLLDPADAGQCRVEVAVEVASLRMADSGMQQDVLSPQLLDAERFPTLGYRGACDGQGIAGLLTLHGVTRPLPLTVLRDGPAYTAQAVVNRFAWGIAGRRFLAGPTIRIRVSTAIPSPPR